VAKNVPVAAGSLQTSLIFQTLKLYIAVMCRTKILTKLETIQIVNKNSNIKIHSKIVPIIARTTIKPRYKILT